MYFCYIDESGTPDIPGSSSHFVLAGLSIPVWHWRDCDRLLSGLKARYSLQGEIHVAWLLRPYLEQRRIPGFNAMGKPERRSQVLAYRTAELLRLQKSGNRKHYRQTKKNFAQTDPYVHLTHEERKELVAEMARHVGQWGFARLFAECIDKVHFVGGRSGRDINEQALEQVVSRFEHYLQILSTGKERRCYGVIIHDNNETVANKQTELMREFHRTGTGWTKLEAIIETPLFVDSSLTSMVQVADLCAYAIRRYVENGEETLIKLIFPRADRKDGVVVGVRHYSKLTCSCHICLSHRK